ncbi:MAG: hypothetical protein ACI9HY_000724 [Planctomycetaceae bacterium]
MLYIVSGASRSGKTLIAKEIMKRTAIPYMSLDWLVMGFTNGIPEYGIHDKLWPNEIAEKFWPFLNAMCKNMLWTEVDYILEGEAVLPKLISDLLKNHPDKVRICFVGYADVNAEDKVRDVKQYSEGKGDWLISEPDDVINSHIENMIGYSKLIKNECADNSLAYVDTSNKFEESLENAVELLLG